MVENLRGQRFGYVCAKCFRFRGIQAARRLHQRIEAAPAGPRALVSVGAERDVDDLAATVRLPPGRSRTPQWRRAGSLARKCRRLAAAPRAFRVHARRANPSRSRLPVAGVDDKRVHGGQMRRGDQQHVSAMRGERAAADRTGDDAGQVEHFDAGERAFASRQGRAGAAPICSMLNTGSFAIARPCGCCSTRRSSGTR